METLSLQAIPLTDIKIPPNRQRREFDPIKVMELANSIEANGLLHPIVVRRVGADTFLVAGERRLRAITDLYGMGLNLRCADTLLTGGLVPCTDLGDLTPLQAEEAELEENVQRIDLTLQERCAAVGRLSDLRAAQAEAQGLPAPTVADLADEIRGSHDGVNLDFTKKEIIISRHLDNPEVAKATSVREAWKALKRQEDIRQNTARAEAMGATFTRASHTLLNCDSLEWMGLAIAEGFDVILTDPPYGMGADEFGDSGGAGGIRGSHAYADTYANWENLIKALAVDSFRLGKPQAHLYCFVDIENFPHAKQWFGLAGWEVFRTPIIFHKPSGSRAPWPEHGPQRKYETILYAIKGRKPVNYLASDVITAPPDAQLHHQAQKPVSLFTELLRRSVRPGDFVLDPFAGTCPIIPAAHSLKCLATAIEIDPAHYGIGLKRLESL